MELTFTNAALIRLQQKMQGKTGYLKLKHDTEGCGCVVSGVAALVLVDKIEESDTKIQTNSLDLYLEYNTEVFFNEEMTIDTAAGNHFTLKSPNEMLNPAMKFYDQTAKNTDR
ncbi:iron-sulfur cluster biosynthesis family protein [Bacillus sp. NEB1478]|uniref:iron-sulfur cluster biosynthesis family protein n=1 Tax=Bacillus sp. NEB1478 TaxID=3073816 RepID=UPI00287326AF|nr:iron-sulfur cluster biosynthesis family protein [Bacillus sp. NEB1478]WNB93640.1 iron-sulfur cluster biosynthesis family protein [Bacillus sp. NEB1478]